MMHGTIHTDQVLGDSNDFRHFDGLDLSPGPYRADGALVYCAEGTIVADCGNAELASELAAYLNETRGYNAAA